MANTLELGNGKWATGKDTVLAFNDENNNFKPLPFSFSRASSGTVVNKDGLIETVGVGEPRIDFKDNTKGALLLEPERSNLFLNSEPTSNEGSTTGITYESFNWFLGFSNCIKFGDNSSVRYRYGGSVSSLTQYTVSAFVIMDDLSEPLVGSGSSVGDFSLVAGGSIGGVVNSNVYYGNNVYRVSTTLTSGSNLGNNGVIKYTTQSSKGFRVVGLQLEQGSYATSYIPTSGSAVTRVVDVCGNGGNEQVINSTEGVLYAEISALESGGVNRYISLSNNTSSNRIQLILSGINANRIIASGSGLTAINYDSYNQTDMNKVAFKYSSSGIKLFVNGVEVGSNNSNATWPSGTFTTLDFALWNQSSLPFHGNVKDIKLYNTALTDQELIALTTI